jgi:hypothetical protein
MNLAALAAFLLARLREPSTYAGLGKLLLLAGIHFSDPQLLPAIVQILVALAGLAAVLIPAGQRTQ